MVGKGGPASKRGKRVRERYGEWCMQQGKRKGGVGPGLCTSLARDSGECGETPPGMVVRSLSVKSDPKAGRGARRGGQHGECSKQGDWT